MPFPDAFATERLTAERLTADHLPELIRMHRDAEVMQHLGGVRDQAQTDAYLTRNLHHWDQYRFRLVDPARVDRGRTDRSRRASACAHRRHR